MTDNILAKLKPGDTVHFACGGSCKPDDIRMESDGTGCRFYISKALVRYDMTGRLKYHSDGIYDYIGRQNGDHPLDIVKVIPCPMTDTERLERIAYILNYDTLYSVDGDASIVADKAKQLLELTTPPERLDPGRDVTDNEWVAAWVHNAVSLRQVATEIVRARLAEAEAQRHD